MEISPNEVVFTPPFEEIRSTQLHLQNTTNHTLIYKVKTTTPQLYSVRPNAASVEAGKTLTVEITRQGRPYSESESRDKFLILSTALEPELAQDPDASIAQIWSQLESSGSGAKIDARKLRVVAHNSQETANLTSDRSSGSHPASHDHAGVAGAGSAASAGTAIGAHGHTDTTNATQPKTVSGESKATDFMHSPSSGANHNLPQKPSGSEQNTAQSTQHLSASEPQHTKEHESVKSSNHSAKSGTSSLPSHGSGPNGSLTVDDLQGTPGVPPKSRLLDEGDALTGPKLANSNLPDGPKASHGLEDKKDSKTHEPAGANKTRDPEVTGSTIASKNLANEKLSDASKSATEQTKTSESPSAHTTTNDKKAESSAQAAAGSEGSQSNYMDSAGEYAQQAREQAGEYAGAAKENLQSAGSTAVNATAAAAGAAAGYVSGATTNVNNWLHNKDANADDPNATTYVDSETSFHDNPKSLGGFEHTVNGGGFEAAGARNSAEKSIAGGPKTSGSDSQPGPSADVHYGVVNLDNTPVSSSSGQQANVHHGAANGIAGATAGATPGAGLSNLPSQGSSAGHHLHNQAQDKENQIKSLTSSNPSIEKAESQGQSLKQSAYDQTQDVKQNVRDQIPSDVKSSLAHGDAHSAIHSSGVASSKTDRASDSKGFTGFDKTINGPAANVGGAYSKNEPESRLLHNPRDTLAFQGNSTTASSGSGTTTAQADGVQQIDVTTAALLALVAFLIGWKFF